MKKLTFIIVLLSIAASGVHAQGAFNYKNDDRYFYYGNVIQVDTSFTVTDLYKDAKLFIAKLALANVKTLADNEKDGTIMLYAEEATTFKTETGIGSEPMKLKYNLKLELKKGRYRYTFDNIVINYVENHRNVDHPLFEVNKGQGGGLLGLGQRKRILQAMDALFLSKIDLLANTMKIKSDDF